MAGIIKIKSERDKLVDELHPTAANNDFLSNVSTDFEH